MKLKDNQWEKIRVFLQGDLNAYIGRMELVIPPYPCATGEATKRPYDKGLYRERHLVECFINKIKHFHRVFSRFDKLAGRYLGFLQFVSSLIWLR